jgi:prepilin-type N-terminal cleavage/methylation domain-containing protein
MRRGFSLIEAVMVMAVLGILSVSGASLMAGLVHNSVFIPNKLNMDMLASEAIRMMVEGDSLARGLRFSRQISGLGAGSEITFINQDGWTVSYQLNSGKLYRSINGGPNLNLPYYSSAAAVTIEGVNGQLFRCYDVNEAVTSNPANVRRVRIDIIARTGSGAYADWQGQSQQSSAAAVKKFQ